MFLGWKVLPLLAIAVYAYTPKTYRLVLSDDGEEFPQEISHNEVENTVTVFSPGKHDVRTSVNFHDFNTGYVVFKDLEWGQCLLATTPTPIATPEVYKLKKAVPSLSKTFKRNRTLSDTEVIDIAGNRIATACADYETVLLDLVNQHNLINGRRSVDQPDEVLDRDRRCLWHCGTCPIEVLHETVQPTGAGGDPAIG